MVHCTLLFWPQKKAFKYQIKNIRGKQFIWIILQNCVGKTFSNIDSIAILHNNRIVIIYISVDSINCFRYGLRNALSR